MSSMAIQVHMKDKGLELRLDEVLKELGWTQLQLAKKMDTSPQWISQLVLNKIPDVHLTTLARLSSATGVPVEKLLRTTK